jgi:uncharacterized radical SAM superfamily Fe-S cluster-containing enzyme
VLPAEIAADEHSQVWMRRSCPEHGEASTMIWPDAEHYQWMMSLAFPKVLPRRDALAGDAAKPCPTGCGICHRHQRRPTLVEIEVTQRCNLRCPVCFMSAEEHGDAGATEVATAAQPTTAEVAATAQPTAAVAQPTTTEVAAAAQPTAAVAHPSTDPSLATIAEMYERIASTAGIETGVQVTGGEPTLRTDLPEIIRLGRERGFQGIEVNTNGLVIANQPQFLQSLVDAGLTGVYLQFDGISPEPYRQIRGADLLDTKLRAIQNCRDANIQVVLAMTIVSGINSEELGAVIDFALENVDVVAGLALQPAFTSGRFDTRRAVPLTMGDVILMLERQTDGMVRSQDIWPLGCSHPLCDCGTFLVPTEHGYRPVTRDLSRQEYLELYDPMSPQGSVFIDIVAKQGLSPERGLSLIIMNYMDALTMDLERAEECSMFVTLPDGRLIPFCTYQLTDRCGRRVYPPFGLA